MTAGYYVLIGAMGSAPDSTSAVRLARTDVQRGYFYVAGAAALWGLWSLPLRLAERYQALSPVTEALVLFGVMFVSVAPVALWGAKRRIVHRAKLPAAALGGLGALGISDAMNSLCFFWSMQRTTLAIAVLTHYLAPILVALFSPLLLGERMLRRTWGALALALFGLALLLEPWRAHTAGLSIGAALGAASAFFYAANTLISKRLQRWFAPSEILAWHMPTALLTLTIFLPTRGVAIGHEPLLILVCGSLLLGALATVLYLSGLARVPASQACVLTLVEPLVAVGVGVLIWGERLSVFMAAGGTLIVWGAARVLGAAHNE